MSTEDYTKIDEQLTPEQLVQEEVPKNITIHPFNEINQNLQYAVMYQPVYVSQQDPNIYCAGPLLAKLSDIQTDKKFFQSLSETFSIAERNINRKMTPIFHKVEEISGHAVDAFQDSINKFTQNVKDIKSKKKKLLNNTFPVELFSHNSEKQHGESLIDDEEKLLIDLDANNDEEITHRQNNNENSIDF